MAESKTHMVPRDQPDHPGRCQSNSNAQNNDGGQCWNFAVPPSQFCASHGAHKAHGAEQNKALTLYKLTKHQARLDSMAEAGGDQNRVLSLRDEIALARMTLEQIFNSCESNTDLVIASNKIAQLLQTINKLVVDAKKLESALGHLLDKTTVIALADRIVAIVSGEISDPEALTRVGDKISSAIELAVLQRSNDEEG